LVSIIFVLPHVCCSINPCFICSPYIQAVQIHKSPTTLLDVRSIKQILEFEFQFDNSSTSQYFVSWMTISSSKLITCALIHKVIIYNASLWHQPIFIKHFRKTKIIINSNWKLNSQYIAPDLTHQTTYILKDLSKLQFSCTHISPFISPFTDEKKLHKP
jgi:hypothetical protein